MNPAYTPSTEEALATLVSVSGVDRSWVAAVGSELQADEAPKGILPCVGDVLKEDTLLVATDRRVIWLCPSRGESHSIPYADLEKVAVPRISWGPTQVVLEFADGNEKSFGVWGKRKSEARAFAKTTNGLRKATGNTG